MSLLVGSPVALSLAPDAPPDGCTWIQVAAEGEFRGHPIKPFALTPEVFGQIAANFRRHPSYRANAEGVGCADVVPFDFHHASEKQAPSVAVTGSPAQAWAQELELRVGEDGKAQLWCLTRWLEPARTYVREQKYRWCSICVWPDAKDPVSGAPIGWYLSSVALTNDPFIQGMQPITAERPATDTRKHDMELLKLLASRFNIPADEAAVHKAILAELDAAGQATSQLEAICQALGVPDPKAAVDKIVGMLRSAKALEEALPALAALKEQQVDSEEKAVEVEVEGAMAAHRIPAAAKPALLFQRRGGIHLSKETVQSPDFGELMKRRAEARTAFLAQYPTPSPDKAHLLHALATPSAGSPPASNPAAPAAGPASTLSLIQSHPGRNDLERAVALVRSQTPGIPFPFPLAHRKACELLAAARQ